MAACQPLPERRFCDVSLRNAAHEDIRASRIGGPVIFCVGISLLTDTLSVRVVSPDSYNHRSIVQKSLLSLLTRLGWFNYMLGKGITY